MKAWANEWGNKKWDNGGERNMREWMEIYSKYLTDRRNGKPDCINPWSFYQLGIKEMRWEGKGREEEGELKVKWKLMINETQLNKSFPFKLHSYIYLKHNDKYLEKEFNYQRRISHPIIGDKYISYPNQTTHQPWHFRIQPFHEIISNCPSDK